MVGSRFKYLCTYEENKKIEKIKEAMGIQWHNISDEGIVQEMNGWVDDPLYFRTRDTKYFKSEETLDSKGHGGPRGGKSQKGE
jgi:hypothetical protein